MRYWVNTVSREHVLAGIQGSFTQAEHGRATALKRLAQGDLIVFYSPRTQFQGGQPFQRFIALARVQDKEPYQVEMTPTFRPWRRRLEFLPCEEAPIQPLIEILGFIQDKRRWGFPFRRGLFEISAEDFSHIAHAMQAEVTR